MAEHLHTHILLALSHGALSHDELSRSGAGAPEEIGTALGELTARRQVEDGDGMWSLTARGRDRLNDHLRG